MNRLPWHFAWKWRVLHPLDGDEKRGLNVILCYKLFPASIKVLIPVYYPSNKDTLISILVEDN